MFECARDIHGTLAPAFYGLRTSLMTMLLMALLRIKRPEALKEHAPEVKTLRRKLARLAAVGRAADFGRALAERRIAQRGQPLGFLDVDGHVRVYHGKHTIPKAFVPQRRLAVAATTDCWGSDQRGDPLFVVTAAANAGMGKMLPVVLEQIRALIGKRRVTVVFDRGGFSPKPPWREPSAPRCNASKISKPSGPSSPPGSLCDRPSVKRPCVLRPSAST